MSSTNQIPPWNRLAVDAKTAAEMMSVGRSTFFARVKAGMYPPSANDGRWNVSELRLVLEREQAAAAEAQRLADEAARAAILADRLPKPVPLAPGVQHLYRHFDSAGTLLYVGISFSTLRRLMDHRKTADWFWKIARVEVQGYATRADVMLAERIAIQLEKPLHNIVHATRIAE